MYKSHIKLIFLITTALLSACTTFHPADHQEVHKGVPSQFSMFSENSYTGKWWEHFNNPELNKLIAAAAKDNFSIKEAYARMIQARFNAYKSGASQLPVVNFGSEAAYISQKQKGTKRTDTDDWSLGLTASYEVDLWGRILADKNSAFFKAGASNEELKSALISVTTQITENWLSLLSNKKQENLYLTQLELQKNLLRVIKLRFPTGQATALDIYQQQQAIERLKAALIPVKSRQTAIKRELAFLLGRADINEFHLSQDTFPEIKDIPAIGLPADLLAARPDIRAAGLRLKAADWEVTAAKADRLPTLDLSIANTFSTSKLDTIFNNWLLRLTASLAGPIFDGNKRGYEVERTKAVVDERLAAYRKTVFNAVKEVEDALASEKEFRETVQSQERQLALSEKTMREARNRYLNGSTDFLNVLREELNNQLLQQSLITSKEKMILARIGLYKALGGAWADELQAATDTEVSKIKTTYPVSSYETKRDTSNN